MLMQATIVLAAAPPLLLPPPIVTHKCLALPRLQNFKCHPIKVRAVANDSSTADYSSSTSVFPAEACDTIGGEACDVEMYPEVKLQPDARLDTPSAPEQIDRDYLDYNSPKTVFLDEACDDLGGEFCEPAGYQGQG